jgi:F-box/leucine-rich repeat protein 10/11
MSHTQRPVDLEASSYFGTSHDHNGIAQTNLTSAERKTHVGQTSYASPPAFQSDTVVMEVDGAAVSKPTASLVSPPTSQADETDVPPEQDGEKDNHVVYYTPTASSRHSSRQPRHVDRYVPESQPAKAVKTTAHTPSARRASFSGPTTARRVTPGAQGSSKKSASRPSSSHAKKGISPATEKKFDRMTTTSTSPGHKGPKRERTAIADDEPDAESLRLIRELQEQEFGLRKRTTRV